MRRSENALVWLLRRCIKCDRYTLHQNECPICGGPVKIPHPAKFSMDDRYRRYRLRMRRMAKVDKAQASEAPHRSSEGRERME